MGGKGRSGGVHCFATELLVLTVEQSRVVDVVQNGKYSLLKAVENGRLF